MTVNTYAPTQQAAPLLITEPFATTGGSRDSMQTGLTKVGAVPVAALLEVYGTGGGILGPRLTTTQMNALTPLVAGIRIFNTTLGVECVYNGTAWIPSPGSLSLSAEGTMTAAQFIAAGVTPRVLVAAQGANTVIRVKGFVLELIYVSAQYANGGEVRLQYGTTALGGGTVISTVAAAGTITGATATTVCIAPPIAAAATKTLTANVGVYFTNATGAFDTGDSTFFWHIDYSVITVT